MTNGCPMGFGDQHASFGAAGVKPSQQESALRLDFSNDMSYGDYLLLERVLSAQRLHAGVHDEMLFIVQHQVSELWMKLMLHELSACVQCIKQDDLDPAFKMLARVSRIFNQLVQAWEVLATMTPADYTALRPVLGHSSGFQSYQYRCMEFMLGNKNAMMLEPHRHRDDLLKLVQAAYEAPSLYDHCLQLLVRRGFSIPHTHLVRDWTQPYQAHAAIEQAWLTVYRDTKTHWDLYQLAEKLIDIEDAFRLWRFRHLTTVERVIGFKQGTGGTSGVSYLRGRLDVVLFPELWQVRTHL